MTMKMFAMLPAALLITGCASPKAAPQVPQAVQTQRVGSDPRETAAPSATRLSVEPDLEIPLSFRIPGYVVALKQVRGEGGRMRDIAEGDRVGRGTVLVRIRADEYGDRVRQATSQAGAAEALAAEGAARIRSCLAAVRQSEPDQGRPGCCACPVRRDAEPASGRPRDNERGPACAA